MRLVVAFVALAWSSAGFAQTYPISFPPNPNLMPGGGWEWSAGSNWADPPPPRMYLNGQYKGMSGVKLVDPRTVSGPAGPLDLEVSRFATHKALGRAAALALKTLPFVATGVAIWELWDQGYRIRPDGLGGLIEDPGTAQVDRSTWKAGPENCYQSGKIAPAGYGPSKQQAAGGYVEGYSAACSEYTITSFGYTSISQTATVQGCSATLNSCTITGTKSIYSYYNASQTGGTTLVNFSFDISVTPTTTKICPASVDPLDPAYSIPEGSAPGPDGKCRTARYHHTPVSVDQAAGRVDTKPFDDPPAVAEMLDGLKQVIEGVPSGVTGPASQTGQPTTTTTQNPDGTTITTTKTPTYNYSYSDNRVTWNITNTTTTVNNSTGQTTTTTESKPATEYDPEDPCVKSPELATCAKFGDPPGGDLNQTTINLDVSPQDGWGEGNASCPEPRVVPFFGSSITIDNTLMCDFVSGIRFAVIGTCAILAALLFLGGLRQ